MAVLPSAYKPSSHRTLERAMLRKRVCEKHFDKHQFDEEGKRLWYSNPTLFTSKEIAHGEPFPPAGTGESKLLNLYFTFVLWIT